MTALAATAIVVGGMVALASLVLGIACRDWRPAVILAAVVVAAFTLAMVMAYAMAALMGEADVFWTEMTS